LLLTSGFAEAFGGFVAQVQQVLDNPAVRRGVRDVTNWVGDRADDVARYNARVNELRRQAHERARQQLQEDANNENLPAWQREGARKRLMAENERYERSQNRREEFEDELMRNGAALANTAFQGVMQEVFSRAAHERKLEEVLTEASERRKGMVESVQVVVNALTDGNNLTKYVLALGGVFALYFGLQHGIAYVAEQYRKPDLADQDKTSLKFGPINLVKSLIYGTAVEDSSLSDVILKPELAAEANDITKSLKNIVMNGGYFDNLMLWGQPGTGKTMLAMRMARSCGLEYIYFTASNLEPFSTEEASAQIVQLFRYAQNSPRKIMIIIDEAEALLGSRSRPDMTDKKRTLLNLVLGYTGTESRDYMVTVLTNRPQDIDEAFLSRCGMRIQIGAPDKTERLAIIKSYVDKILRKASNLRPEKPSVLSPKYWFGKQEQKLPPTIEDGALSEEALEALSDRLDGFVGRDISKLIFRIQGTAFTTEDNMITAALVKKAVDRMLKERAEQDIGFIRDGANKGVPKVPKVS
jgi:ATPase family AAA domain-containing protein 3A/B